LEQVLDAYVAPLPIGDLPGNVPLDSTELDQEQPFERRSIAGYCVD
jgi:hypothetical protein